MPKIKVDITVTWTPGTSRPIFLKGYEISITPEATTMANVISERVIGKTIRGKQTSYTIKNVELSEGETYKAWVRSIEIGGTSDFIASNVIVIAAT